MIAVIMIIMGTAILVFFFIIPLMRYGFLFLEDKLHYCWLWDGESEDHSLHIVKDVEVPPPNLQKVYERILEKIETMVKEIKNIEFEAFKLWEMY